MSAPDLSTAIRDLANDIYAMRDDRSSDGAFEMVKKLDHAALGLEVLAHIVSGKSIVRAFGAPGDWGYGSPMGNALLRFLRDLPAHVHQQEGATEIAKRLNAAQQLLMGVACQPSDSLSEELRANLRTEALAGIETLRKARA